MVMCDDSEIRYALFNQDTPTTQANLPRLKCCRIARYLETDIVIGLCYARPACYTVYIAELRFFAYVHNAINI